MYLYSWTLTSLLALLYFCPASSQFLQSITNFMPTRPVMSPRDCFKINAKHGRVIRFISDQQTKCMYWECTSSRPVPRQCGLQTYISEFFEGDEYNPCTERYSNNGRQFDCTRKGFDSDGRPICKKLYEDNGTCKNGGTVTYQGNLCWCVCAPDFTGFDCVSEIVKTTTPAPTTTKNPKVNTRGNPPEVPTTLNNGGNSLIGVNRRGALGGRDDPRSRLQKVKSRNDRRQRILFMRVRARSAVNDDADNTGALLFEGPRGQVPFSKTIDLNEGVNTAGDESLPPSDVEFAEHSGVAMGPVSPVGTRIAVDAAATSGQGNPVATRGQGNPVATRGQGNPVATSGQGNPVATRESVNSAGTRGSVSLPVSPPVSPPVAKVDKNGKFNLGDPCPKGYQRDFCAEQDGCLNGGTCVNQCLGAICLCRPPYTAGRRCEQYWCTDNVECMNGGTCRRGLSGINPVATCTCLAGFRGPMCEINMASVDF